MIKVNQNSRGSVFYAGNVLFYAKNGKKQL